MKISEFTVKEGKLSKPCNVIILNVLISKSALLFVHPLHFIYIFKKVHLGSTGNLPFSLYVALYI